MLTSTARDKPGDCPHVPAARRASASRRWHTSLLTAASGMSGFLEEGPSQFKTFFYLLGSGAWRGFSV